MGQEAVCKARFGRKTSEGRALLESDNLLFRGDFRLEILHKEVKSVGARRGPLRVTFPKGLVTFDLGPLAEK